MSNTSKSSSSVHKNDGVSEITNATYTMSTDDHMLNGSVEGDDITRMISRDIINGWCDFGVDWNVLTQLPTHVPLYDRSVGILHRISNISRHSHRHSVHIAPQMVLDILSDGSTSKDEMFDVYNSMCSRDEKKTSKYKMETLYSGGEDDEESIDQLLYKLIEQFRIEFCGETNSHDGKVVLFVEGNVGVGKTTLINSNRLESGLESVYSQIDLFDISNRPLSKHKVTEPVQLWCEKIVRIKTRPIHGCYHPSHTECSYSLL